MSAMDDLREYYQRNPREFWIIAVSVMLGVALIGFNTLNYQSSTVLFQQDTSALDDRLRTITATSSYETTFVVDNAADLSNINIEVVVANISQRSALTVVFNNEVLQDNVADLGGQTVQTLTPDVELVGTRNVLEISGSFPTGGQAQVESVTVTGYTGLQRTGFLLLNLLGLLIMLGPGLGLKYYQYKRRTAIEDRFPDFLRDVVEGTRSGMSLPQSIKNTEDNDYGVMTEHVQHMSAKLDWGIPFDRVLTDFAEHSRSQIVRRAVNTINQTYKSGGNVSDVLDSVGGNLKEIKKLRRQRESELYGEMITGYVVYFIFLAVMVMLIKYLVPSLSFPTDVNIIGIGGGGGGTSGGNLVESYRPLFRNLIIIQAVFSGLVIGKLTGGKLQAGARHVAILLITGYMVSIIAL